MKTVIAATIMLAHSWYPGACCHDQDCHPVPCNSLRANGLGLSWDGVVFTDDMIKDSMDENCHVCVHSVGRYRYPYCVFLPKLKQADAETIATFLEVVTRSGRSVDGRPVGSSRWLLAAALQQRAQADG